MSTTTSVENSGLLTAILPAFERATRIDVQMVAVGSGRALVIFESGDADAALTHDPDAEQTIVGRGVTSRYRKIMFNDFVIAGPPGARCRKRGCVSCHAPDRVVEGAVCFSR